jgi:hypothetical protein
MDIRSEGSARRGKACKIHLKLLSAFVKVGIKRKPCKTPFFGTTALFASAGKSGKHLVFPALPRFPGLLRAAFNATSQRAAGFTPAVMPHGGGEPHTHQFSKASPNPFLRGSQA